MPTSDPHIPSNLATRAADGPAPCSSSPTASSSSSPAAHPARAPFGSDGPRPASPAADADAGSPTASPSASADGRCKTIRGPHRCDHRESTPHPECETREEARPWFGPVHRIGARDIALESPRRAPRMTQNASPTPAEPETAEDRLRRAAEHRTAMLREAAMAEGKR